MAKKWIKMTKIVKKWMFFPFFMQKMFIL